MAYDYSKFLSGMVTANQNYGQKSNPYALPGFYSPSNNQTVSAGNSAYNPSSGQKPSVGSTYNGWTYGTDGAWHGDKNSVGSAPMVSGGGGYTSPINYAGLATIAQMQKQQRIQQGTNKLNTMYGDAKNAQLEAIRRAANTAQTGLASSERTATQQAYNSRNMIDAEAAKNAMKLKEMMAAQGLLSSGENLTANMEQNNARLNSLNNVNQAETNTLQSIADKRNEINSSAASQEIELAKQIEADKAKAMMQLEQYEDERYLQQDRDAYNRFRDEIERQDKLAQQDFMNRISKSALTGEFNEYQSQIDQMMKNSSDWFKADQNERLRLSEENNRIGQQIGAVKDASGDWIMPQAKKTLDAQKWDKDFKAGLIQSGLNTYGYAPNNLDNLDVGDFYNSYNGATPLNVLDMNARNGLARDKFALDTKLTNAQISNMEADNLRASQPKATTAKPVSYKQMPEFEQSKQYIYNDPYQALVEIEANKNEIMASYGSDGYADLIGLAKKLVKEMRDAEMEG